MRAPDGTFDEATPIYRSVSDVKEKSNLTQRQEDSMQEFIHDLAVRYKQSMDKSKQRRKKGVDIK